MRLVNTRKKYGLHALEEDMTSPLSANIRSVVLPSEFKTPQITPCDGKPYPHDHLRSHVTSLLGKGATDEIRYLVFLATLEGMATYWFYSLAPSLILGVFR